MVLCIETATNLCSVALCSRSGVIDIRESREVRSHASQLTVYIDEMLRKNGLEPSALEAVAVGKGPGSYTGLRIGVSVAKGIAYAVSVPLIGIETTLSMFHGICGRYAEPEYDPVYTLFCPMIDARRMEVYDAVYDFMGKPVQKISAEIINENSFRHIPGSFKIVFFGDGAAKCKEVITRKNVVFDDNFKISAAFMQKPVYQALNDRHFENVAYFEPFYLKDFMTSVPGRNILGR